MANPVPIDIQKISGTDGSVRMPDAGILVGWFSAWSMTKRSDGTYVFRGTFGHVNETLWAAKYRKQITLKTSRERSYQLCQEDDAAVEFNAENKTLVIERSHLCQDDKGPQS